MVAPTVSQGLVVSHWNGGPCMQLALVSRITGTDKECKLLQGCRRDLKKERSKSPYFEFYIWLSRKQDIVCSSQTTDQLRTVGFSLVYLASLKVIQVSIIKPVEVSGVAFAFLFSELGSKDYPYMLKHNISKA